MLNRPDLHLAGEVGQLVQREDSAVGARQHAVVHRQLVGEDVTAARRLDRIEIADDVGDRDVGRRELLDVALSRSTHAIGVSSPRLVDAVASRTSRSARTDCR